MGDKRERFHAGNKGIQENILRFLYQTKPGSLLLKVLVNPYISKAAGYLWTHVFQCH